MSQKEKLTYVYLETPNDFLPSSDISDTYNCFDIYVNNDELFIKDSSGEFEYDFCNGFRIHFFNSNVSYMLTVSDTKGNIIFNSVFVPDTSVVYAYSKIYCIEYVITISHYNYVAPEMPPFRIIKYNPNNQPIGIFISFSNQRSGLGDTIAWINAILYYAEKYPEAKISIVATNPFLEKFLWDYTNISDYKHISFVEYNSAIKKPFYAEYLIGYFNASNLKNSKDRYNYFKESNCFDGLITAGLDILGIEGVDGYKEKPKLKIRNIPKKKSKEPYVCISTNASSFYKKWINNDGWERVIDYIHVLGYDIYCIDQNNAEEYNNIIRTYMPEGVIDDTGNKPFEERAEMLINCEFFIGLGSGLSWLAWLCDVPVVLISGFSKPKSEFYTPYRVINYNVCNGCWNELNLNWDSTSCCPMYGNNINNKNFLACSFAIRSEAVIKVINQIPSVKERLKNE